MLRFFVAAALASLAAGSGPALGADAASCPPGTEEFAEYRLFFGRSQGAIEVVSEEAWRAFLADEVTPRFPAGLTVLDASGQWRDDSGEIVRERTKLLLVLAPPGGDAMQRTDEIAEAYKLAFGQSSVLRAVTQACASF
ncbi:MAG: DUF3574 domain-containing protein [Rhodospirillales bacterium]|nr:DUF3574 domain-containing protein [Rhodospirillales bacterium]